MKFQKGLLSDAEKEAQKADALKRTAAASPPAEGPPSIQPDPVLPGDGHLFETLEEESSGNRKYIKVFAIVVLLVIAAGIGIFYLTLPGVGDQVRAPSGLETALRDHFLIKEKRTATDIVFYKCDGYYSAKVGVETRTDIPNPIFRVDTYAAKATAASDGWQVQAAAPLPSPEPFVPCK